MRPRRLDRRVSQNAHAFRAKAAGTSNSETQIAVRNARKVGPIEVHEIDINLVDRDGCAPSERDDTDALVYVVRPGEEALIVSSKRQPKAGDAADYSLKHICASSPNSRPAATARTTM